MYSKSRRGTIHAAGTAAVVVVSLLGASGWSVAATTEGKPAASASAAEEPQNARAIAEQVQRDIVAAWPKVPRYWPGLDFSKLFTIVSSNKGQDNFLVDLSGVRALTKADLAKEKVEIPPAGYNEATWKGRQGIILSADIAQEAGRAGTREQARQVFLIATHELFHFHGQKGWKTTSGNVLRGTPYPVKAEPRLARVSLINALRKAWLAQNPAQRDKHLAAAAYWNQQWKQKAPEERELAHGTDVAEGTARYIEAAALQHTFTGNEAARKKQVAASLLPERSGVLPLDDESYDAGGLAALILAGQNKCGWHQRVSAKNQSPIDILLEGITPRAQQPAPALAKNVRDQIAQEQKQATRTVAPLLAAYNNGKNALLRIPETAAQGSYNPGKFYVRSGPGARQIYTGLTASYKVPSGTVKFTGRPVFTEDADGKSYVVVPLDPTASATKLNGTKLTLNDKSLTGTITVKDTRDGNRRILTAQ